MIDQKEHKNNRYKFEPATWCYKHHSTVQVVDNLSMKMVSACTKMHELSAEGITSKKISMRMWMRIRIRMRMRTRMSMRMKMRMSMSMQLILS